MTYSPKILITGCDGQIGTALRTHSLAHQFQLIPCQKHDCDITQADSIINAISSHKPDIIINTAAYTAVDKAETDIATAMRINADGPRQLAILANQHQIPLIHLSTDYVFSGNKQQGYTENDIAEPLNQYGKSKWLGEEAIREHHDKAVILRISAVFSEHKTNFLKTILRLAKERETLTIVDDQITRPTYAGHIAEVIYQLIRQQVNTGTYHYADSPPVSWYTFATHIVEEARKQMPLKVACIQPINTKDYPTPAKRPPYAVLATTHLEQTLGLSTHHWQQGIIASINTLCHQENLA